MTPPPVCYRCREELERPGALAFEPPINGLCRKFHICWDCWPDIEAALKGEAPS